MPESRQPDLSRGTSTIRHQNIDLSGGVNQRMGGRRLAENESSEHINADISVPGIRRKRMAPLLVAALVAGMAPTNTCPCGGEFTGTDTVLSWSPVTDATSYDVELYEGISCDGTPIFQETVTA